MSRTTRSRSARACCIASLLLLLAVPARAGRDAGNADPGDAGGRAPVGRWHTVSIHGDLLFLVIREVRLTIRPDGSFTASVQLRDGKEESVDGSYEVVGSRLHFRSRVESGRVAFRLKDRGKVLEIHDEAFHVRVELSRMG